MGFIIGFVIGFIFVYSTRAIFRAVLGEENDADKKHALFIMAFAITMLIFYFILL